MRCNTQALYLSNLKSMKMEIYSIKKLSSLLHLKGEYLLDLSNRAGLCYKILEKPKHKNDPSAGMRTISIPNDELKSVQQKINDIILSPLIAQLPDYMHGARSGKNTLTCAKVHCGKDAILSIDLKNCYPSITNKMVLQTFRTKLKCSNEIARLLTKLTTHNHSLPQGAPTSPSLCNLILQPLVQDLFLINQKSNLTLSQFLDDIFCSGQKSVLELKKQDFYDIFTKYGFKINKRKSKISSKESSMKVLGITIYPNISCSRKKIRTIQRQILRLSVNDFEEYKRIIEERKELSRKRALGQKVKYPKYHNRVEHAQGQIAYISSINPSQGKILQSRFEKQLAKYNLI